MINNDSLRRISHAALHATYVLTWGLFAAISAPARRLFSVAAAVCFATTLFFLVVSRDGAFPWLPMLAAAFGLWLCGVLLEALVVATRPNA